MDLVPGQKAVGPGPSRKKMDLDQESDTDESSDQDTRSWVGTKLISAMQQQSEQKPHQTSEEGDPTVEQDESMHSPTPVDPPTNTTSTPHPPSPSTEPSVPLQDDVHMGSPMSDKSAPSPRQMPLPLPSLMSVMQSQSHPPKDGLFHHPYLETMDLAVNAEFGFLTCLICQSALAVDEVKHHLTNLHQTRSRYDENLFKAAILATKVAPMIPSNIAGPRPIVHGLKVHDGVACSMCKFVSRSGERLRKHHSQHHATMPRPSLQRPCKIQQLRQGAGEGQTFWEVEGTQTRPTLHQSLVDSLLKELEPTLQVVQIPLDGRMVSPWLLTTRWHEHMAGKDIKQLCSLVALPKNNDGDIPGLRDAVEAYYEEALSLLDRTGELVLQRLNSPDPTKSGISNTPFHKHLYKSTMKQYILPVVALLAMLIRQEYSGKDFTGSDNKLMDLLAVLRIQDPEEGGRDALPLIHELLFQVWSTAWTHQGDGDIVDPTERCLALMMLRQDGAFKEPQEVTPVIARLEYCMRLTFLKEIHQRMHLDPESDELDHCLALESFFTEKTRYTFSRLRSLQHRVSSLAYDTMSLPQVWWTDTKTWKTMLYRGEQGWTCLHSHWTRSLIGMDAPSQPLDALPHRDGRAFTATGCVSLIWMDAPTQPLDALPHMDRHAYTATGRAPSYGWTRLHSHWTRSLVWTDVPTQPLDALPRMDGRAYTATGRAPSYGWTRLHSHWMRSLIWTDAPTQPLDALPHMDGRAYTATGCAPSYGWTRLHSHWTRSLIWMDAPTQPLDALPHMDRCAYTVTGHTPSYGQTHLSGPAQFIDELCKQGSSTIC
ncbi:hypothetical protein F5141DRAFT_1066224 [Pisolithus sp. B1]|nr:hypothetical protein F5141DRAFT_1066224 [Pisolithus sp. B1]